MIATMLTSCAPRTWALVLDRGDDVVDRLRWFALDEELDGGALNGTGAIARAVLGTVDSRTGACRRVVLDEHLDVVWLTGSIMSDGRGRPQVDARLLVARSDATVCGGRLVSATADPLVELVLSETPAHLQRDHDEQTGLALLRHARRTPPMPRTLSDRGMGEITQESPHPSPELGPRRRGPASQQLSRRHGRS